ncbi:glycosyltransferase family 2 protein [Brucella anthropi]|uniref:glycosyltransferase family 2 protein n=1 Tax=Brucella anthropi TaxID=529 RepID=UPI001AEE7072|nr:glycosyltransferase family 2 protein [Brucella anthropi]
MTTMNDKTYKKRSVPPHNSAVCSGKKSDYALVIPVINEGKRIRAQLHRIKDAALPVDIIIADGGSTDGSLDHEFLIEQRVRALLTKTGPGRLSAQLRMAYAWCLDEGYKGIVTIDGNGKDNVEAVEDFVAALDAGYDYVQGSRYCPGGVAENTPLERTIGNRMIHAPLMSLAGKRWYTDTTNGFRGYSSRYLEDARVLPFRDVFMNYELLFYLTVRAGQLNYRTCEIPVRRSYPKGESTPTKITGIRAKLLLLGQALNAACGKYTP